MKPLKEIGASFPTVFNLKEMWDLNAKRCGGKFNLLFFWMYPLAAVALLPFTVLCLVEWVFDR